MNDDDPIRVMLVDDQPATRLGFSMMMSVDRTLRVVAQAGDGREALDLLRAMRDEDLPDVVLMDVRMPVMDGIDATRLIRARYPGTRVLILTTYDEDSYGGLDAGASGFLLKDVTAEQLRRAVHAVHDGDAILTPRLTREVLEHGVPRTTGAPAAASGAAGSPGRAMFDALTPRELDVAALVAEGLTNAEIGERLIIQPDSVKRTVTRVLARLGMRDRVQIVVAWYRTGMRHTV
ncbi:response regulator transcription factor [Bifidobacterium sp. MA2]|uniref:Response regulator transcription factor n=1 Tax=Bifidobacterium santillanense TaxID=2809028 RepID=A0ABS5UM27_9BIFI|nr:response regulator transcription factor [Bifidobacterium santillanense]MBT1171960.1 response regulator transcription factor [Bifidobacterium santillanense]